MIPAKLTDKNTVINIITECFKDNPGVNYIIGKKKNKSNRLKALAEYAFDFAYYREGIYLTKNKSGLAICYLLHYKPRKLYDLWLKIKLVTRAIGWSRVHAVLLHMKKMNERRHKDGNYLYFWFMGVTNEGRENIKTAVEIMNYIFKLSISLHATIFAETSVYKNKMIYQRLGFQTYNQLSYPNIPLHIWFMRRSPHLSCRWMKD